VTPLNSGDAAFWSSGDACRYRRLVSPNYLVIPLQPRHNRFLEWVLFAIDMFVVGGAKGGLCSFIYISGCVVHPARCLGLKRAKSFVRASFVRAVNQNIQVW